MSAPSLLHSSRGIATMVLHNRYVPHLIFDEKGIRASSLGVWNLHRFANAEARSRALCRLVTSWLEDVEVDRLVATIAEANERHRAMLTAARNACGDLGVELVVRQAADVVSVFLGSGDGFSQEDLARPLGRVIFPELPTRLGGETFSAGRRSCTSRMSESVRYRRHLALAAASGLFEFVERDPLGAYDLLAHAPSFGSAEPVIERLGQLIARAVRRLPDPACL